MTYCLAWRTNKAAFLLADTTVTFNKSLGQSYSSFNELQGTVGETSVVESLLKINVLGRNCAVAFAGDVHFANSIVDTLKSLLELGEPPQSAFRRAVQSNLPVPSQKTVSLIFAYFALDEPRLLHFDSREPALFPEDQEIVQIGSIESYYPAFSDHWIRSFMYGTSKPENILAAVTGIAQSYGVHSVLSQMNVGGAFFGLYIDQSGVYWQDDTTYVLYHEHQSQLSIDGLITVGVRENVLFVGSSFLNAIKFMSNHTSAHTIEQWFHSWKDSIRNLLRSYQSEYYIFLSTKDHMVTIVRTYGNLKNEFFQIHPKEGNRIHFYIHDNFFKFIKDINSGPAQDGLPYRLSWLHATSS